MNESVEEKFRRLLTEAFDRDLKYLDLFWDYTIEVSHVLVHTYEDRVVCMDVDLIFTHLGLIDPVCTWTGWYGLSENWEDEILYLSTSIMREVVEHDMLCEKVFT